MKEVAEGTATQNTSATADSLAAEADAHDERKQRIALRSRELTRNVERPYRGRKIEGGKR